MQMIVTYSFISYAHRMNLKHYILTASFCVSYHFSVTAAFGILLAIDLHSAPFFPPSPSGTETGAGSCREPENPASSIPKDGPDFL